MDKYVYPVLSVPNSNPISAFSRFEIWMSDERVATPVEYALYGVDEENAVLITEFENLTSAKKLLVELNGPLPEHHDDEE